MAFRGQNSENEKTKQEANKAIEIAAGVICGVGLTTLAGYGIYRLLTSSEDTLDINSIGVNCNSWRHPKTLSLSKIPGSSKLFKEDEVNLPDDDWTQSTKTVNMVLDLLMREMREDAAKYEGLVLEDCIKQGSAREGLKVHLADEFDVLLLFRINGLEYRVENVTDDSRSNRMLPELAYLRVAGAESELMEMYPKLYRKGVFTEDQAFISLNSRNLSERVFKSIVASASSRVQSKVTVPDGMEHFECHIDIRSNPPSINIKLTIKEREKEDPVFKAIGTFVDFFLDTTYDSGASRNEYRVRKIDVDIVPGLLLEFDKVPDPTRKDRSMDVPRYAVLKWFTDNHRSSSRYNDKSLLWRNCSSGYEKHVMDIAWGMKYQNHIIAALRLLKLYFSKERQKNPYQQILTVLRSYYLKHVAFFCILFLRVINKEEITSVNVAMAYLLRFLKICVIERKLPHFFHSNRLLVHMFPNYKYSQEELRYNLFDRTPVDALRQVELSFPWLEEKLSPITDGCNTNVNIVNEFNEFVMFGEYFS